MSIFRFSKASEFQLATLDSALQRVLRRALSMGVLDFTISVGFRDQAAQEAAFAAGLSEKHWPDGNHNHYPSTAVDIAPVLPPELAAKFLAKTGSKIPWKDLRYWFALTGVILAAAAEEGVRIRWGGDWDADWDLDEHKLKDYGHFELA